MERVLVFYTDISSLFLMVDLGSCDCLIWRVLSNPMVKACQWIVDHQLSDGGWGENFESCERKVYVAAVQSQVLNTAWALLGLMAVRWDSLDLLTRLNIFLNSSQRKSSIQLISFGFTPRSSCWINFSFFIDIPIMRYGGGNSTTAE